MSEFWENSKDKLSNRNTRLILTGTKNVLIENYDRIISFDADQIIIQGYKNRILIAGYELWIEHYDGYDITIRGKIANISFVENAI